MSVTVVHVLVPEPPGELGGADMHVRDLVTYQISVGMTATVVERGSTEFADRMRRAGVGVVSASGLSFRAAVRRLAQEIAARDPDVVHAHGYDADYWAAAARWRYPSLFRDRSLVFTQHGVVEDTLWHRGKTLLDALCMRAADGVIVCAAGVADRMQRWCPTGVVGYIPNGVQVPRTPPRREARRQLGLSDDAFVVGYVGRLSPEKRPDRILTLIADARSAEAPVTAVIAGSGPLRPTLERQAAELGLGDAIIFAGLVHDIGSVYGALDGLALLSDTESTSRVVIEAMATGVPVLASAVGGVPELLDHGRVGYLVPRGERETAVVALRELVSDPTRFVAVARERALKLYVAEVMGGEITSFYQRLRAGTSVDGAGGLH
jgi:glycosyltransferase involved in cell wall biosynthesis